MTTPNSNPFVNFTRRDETNIESTPKLIFGSEFTCCLDGMIFCNITPNVVLISSYILRVDGEQTKLLNNMPLKSLEIFDWVYQKGLYLSGGETIWAYSDQVNNLFNVLCSYRELLELTPSASHYKKSTI